MKSPTLPQAFSFLLALLLLAGCASSKTTFTFPEHLPGTIESALSSPWTHLPSKLEFGNTHACRDYTMPQAAPSLQAVLDHYQAQMEDQGWQGEPSQLSMDDNKLNVTWLDEESNAGVMVIYMPELWQAIVCIGNP